MVEGNEIKLHCSIHYSYGKKASEKTIAVKLPAITKAALLIDIVQSKALKAKQKVVALSQLLLDEKVTIDELIATAKAQQMLKKPLWLKPLNTHLKLMQK